MSEPGTHEAHIPEQERAARRIDATLGRAADWMADNNYPAAARVLLTSTSRTDAFIPSLLQCAGGLRVP